MTHCRVYQLRQETFATISFVDIVILAAPLDKWKILMTTDTTNAILAVDTSFFRRSLLRVWSNEYQNYLH